MSAIMQLDCEAVLDMNYLFSSSSLQILESLSFTETLYAFDYDGTLAPIVEDPKDAQMKKGTRLLLEKLCARVPVAIISGRSLSDLRSRVPGNARYLIGNHGLEGLPGTTPVSSLKGQVAKWKDSIAESLGPVTRDLGIMIEDKEYSLALHYRKSRKKKLARQAIQAALKGLEDHPRVMGGKLVLNVVPPAGPHKGVALMRLMEISKCRFAIYVGDDETDEDVFSMGNSRVLSVRVGKGNQSQAKYFIRKQIDIDALLKRILGYYAT